MESQNTAAFIRAYKLALELVLLEIKKQNRTVSNNYRIE